MQTLDRKLDFVDAFRALAAAKRNPDDIESGVKLVIRLEGRSLERFFKRFIADPAGATIVRERLSLFAVLDDREALAKLSRSRLSRVDRSRGDHRRRSHGCSRELVCRGRALRGSTLRDGALPGHARSLACTHWLRS